MQGSTTSGFPRCHRPPAAPPGHGDTPAPVPRRPGGPTPAGKMAFWGWGAHTPRTKPMSHQGWWLPPCSARTCPERGSPAQPCPFPLLSPGPPSSSGTAPAASPDSRRAEQGALCSLPAPSFSAPSTPHRPHRAGGSCRLGPRGLVVDCPLLLALLSPSKSPRAKPLLASALLLPAEMPGALQGRPAAGASPRKVMANGSSPEHGPSWDSPPGQGHPQGIPKASPRLSRDILPPRGSRLCILIRAGDLCKGRLPGSISSCGRTSSLLPGGNKDSSCPGSPPSVGTCPAGSSSSSLENSRGSTTLS